MTDNAFDPTSIVVSEGETIVFRFMNNGAVVHDAFIGDAGEQEEHGEIMDGATAMEGHDMSGGDGLSVEPGREGELTHTFDRSGEFFIGCHQPGHYEGGMVAKVTVS